jgi:hypothetical protein
MQKCVEMKTPINFETFFIMLKRITKLFFSIFLIRGAMASLLFKNHTLLCILRFSIFFHFDFIKFMAFSPDFPTCAKNSHFRSFDGSGEKENVFKSIWFNDQKILCHKILDCLPCSSTHLMRKGRRNNRFKFNKASSTTRMKMKRKSSSVCRERSGKI